MFNSPPSAPQLSHLTRKLALPFPGFNAEKEREGGREGACPLAAPLLRPLLRGPADERRGGGGGRASGSGPPRPPPAPGAAPGPATGAQPTAGRRARALVGRGQAGHGPGIPPARMAGSGSAHGRLHGAGRLSGRAAAAAQPALLERGPGHGGTEPELLLERGPGHGWATADSEPGPATGGPSDIMMTRIMSQMTGPGNGLALAAAAPGGIIGSDSPAVTVRDYYPAARRESESAGPHCQVPSPPAAYSEWNARRRPVDMPSVFNFFSVTSESTPGWPRPETVTYGLGPDSESAAPPARLATP